MGINNYTNWESDHLYWDILVYNPNHHIELPFWCCYWRMFCILINLLQSWYGHFSHYQLLLQYGLNQSYLCLLPVFYHYMLYYQYKNQQCLLFCYHRISWILIRHIYFRFLQCSVKCNNTQTFNNIYTKCDFSHIETYWIYFYQKSKSSSMW